MTSRAGAWLLLFRVQWPHSALALCGRQLGPRREIHSGALVQGCRSRVHGERTGSDFDGLSQAPGRTAVMRDNKSEVAAISDAVHLCVDMQNIFAPGGLWETPWMEKVLPTVTSIA